MISGFEQIVNEERENARQEGISIGTKRGIEQGTISERAHGIQILVESCREFGQTPEIATKKLMEKYSLSPEDAQALVARYWTEK